MTSRRQKYVIRLDPQAGLNYAPGLAGWDDKVSVREGRAVRKARKLRKEGWRGVMLFKVKADGTLVPVSFTEARLPESSVPVGHSGAIVVGATAPEHQHKHAGTFDIGAQRRREASQELVEQYERETLMNIGRTR